MSSLSSLAPGTSTPIIHSRLINICGGPPGKYSLQYRFVAILIFSVHQQPPLVVYYVQSPILSNARRIRPRMTKLNTTAKKCEQSCCVLPIPQYTPISSCFSVVWIESSWKLRTLDNEWIWDRSCPGLLCYLAYTHSLVEGLACACVWFIFSKLFSVSERPQNMAW